VARVSGLGRNLPKPVPPKSYEKIPLCGISEKTPSVYAQLNCAGVAAPGRLGLQRLFSTFPGGKPGLGLLLLRIAVGATSLAAGVLYLSALSVPGLDRWFLGLLLTASGAALLIGFLTPLASLLAALSFLGIGFSWVPMPPWGLYDARVVSVGVIITAVAIALLGPGAFSLDGYLFGRREIVIPPSSRSLDS
jgi:uncharacterized membrane protein YphA (DoxX/SURF4 family)